MTWNGTSITRPMLIYQDEIIVDPTGVLTISTISPNSLLCMSEGQATVGWHLPNGSPIVIRSVNITYTDSGVFKQLQSMERDVSGLSRNRDIISTDAATNGLWTCRLNREANGAFPVGIYIRGRGA